jgi:ABC-type Fe3+-hydroxamate transport system substrate-binding protein
LDTKIVGVTKFCIHPSNQVKDKLKIGGTKNLNIPLITSLKPDLIIANKEENERLQLKELMSAFPTYVSSPCNLDTSIAMINDIGALTGLKSPAVALSDSVSAAFAKLSLIQPLNLRMAYFIWRKPYMVAGKNTFIDNMLQRCGLVNVFEQGRYPEITTQMLVNAKPDVVLLSSEPYPFKQKHIDEFATILPNANVKLVDGEMFSWYGGRLLYAPEYFMRLIDSLK